MPHCTSLYTQSATREVLRGKANRTSTKSRPFMQPYFFLFQIPVSLHPPIPTPQHKKQPKCFFSPLLDQRVHLQPCTSQSYSFPSRWTSSLSLVGRTADRDQGSVVHAGLPHRGADLRSTWIMIPVRGSLLEEGEWTVAVLGYASMPARQCQLGAACGCGVVLGFLGVGEF